MQLIYIHGFNINKSGIKGEWLRAYCKKHHPEIKVVCPDVNLPPHNVLDKLTKLIAKDAHTGIVGTSLGGFFATTCVAQTGVNAVLLNPSVRPFETLKAKYFDKTKPHGLDDVFYTSAGGWDMTLRHLEDLKAMYQDTPAHPHNMMVMLKEGDTVLNYRIALNHYAQDGAQSTLLVEPGGDHLIHDLKEKIPIILAFLFGV